MSLKTRELNASLNEGYISDGLQKDGGHGTFVAEFETLNGETAAKLQQSVDGKHWSDMPNSEVTLGNGQQEQMWNDDITPRGTVIRIVIGADVTGSIVAIKLLSNE